MRRLVVGLVGVALALVGCGDDEEAGPTTAAPSSREEPAVTSTSSPDVTPAVAAALADLAGRAGVDEAEITILENREVTWPDSSLGCPEPGVQYTQVLTNGVLLVLEAGGRRYEYHGGDPLRYCADPTPPAAGD